MLALLGRTQRLPIRFLDSKGRGASLAFSLARGVTTTARASDVSQSSASCYTARVNTNTIALLLAHPVSILPILTFVVGTVGGLLFLLDWLHVRPLGKLLLYWSVGLLFLHWLQVPILIAASGTPVVVEDMDIFISLGYPLTLIGLLLVYLGVATALPAAVLRRLHATIVIELSIAMAVYIISLFTAHGVNADFLLLFVTNLLFFLPVRLLILFALWRWRRTVSPLQTRLHLGITFVMGWALFGVVNHLLVIPKVLAYPPQFWFIALVNVQMLYVMDVMSTPLFLIGMLLLRQRQERNSARAWHA